MNSPRIRPAILEDLPAIVALERSVIEAPHWPAEAYWAISQAGPGRDSIRRCLLVALRCDVLIGFVVGSVLGDVAELESIAVDSAQRRTGAGRALCSSVVEWAWEQDAAEMVLEVRASSTGAIQLYRSLGFVPSGQRPGYYHAPEDDAVLMRLDRPNGR